jgi:predicted benzoate:H+ symporter BenE
MTDSFSGANARLSAFASDQELIAEIPAGISDLLHERAKERYLRRVFQALFLVVLAGFIASIAPGASLTPQERIAGLIAAVGFLGYLVYGFTIAWPERWEHALLLEELEHRRRNGRWRWEA